MAVRVVCGWCGREDVSRDAWAGWDVAAQSRVLRKVFDDGFCRACETRRGLEAVALDEADCVAT